jgi:hypothetical protein
LLKLPTRIVVKEVLTCRYSPGQRPDSWDARRTGLEVIKTDKDEMLTLLSKGGQSSPDVGWELLLNEQVEELEKIKIEKLDDDASLPAYGWTLYGVKNAGR